MTTTNRCPSCPCWCCYLSRFEVVFVIYFELKGIYMHTRSVKIMLRARVHYAKVRSIIMIHISLHHSAGQNLNLLRRFFCVMLHSNLPHTLWKELQITKSKAIAGFVFCIFVRWPRPVSRICLGVALSLRRWCGACGWDWAHFTILITVSWPRPRDGSVMEIARSNRWLVNLSVKRLDFPDYILLFQLFC